MTDALAHSTRQPQGRASGTSGLLLLQFATMWTAFFILAPTINWPASLDEPPSVMLPLILDQSSAVSAGYLSYLIHALALIPLAILLRDALRLQRLRGRRGRVAGRRAFCRCLDDCDFRRCAADGLETDRVCRLWRCSPSTFDTLVGGWD